MQESVESKDSLQSLAAPTKKEVPDTKDIKIQGEGENSSKSDSDSSDDDDDYDDDEFPPVHIKLPLQLDLDDIAGVNIILHFLYKLNPIFSCTCLTSNINENYHNNFRLIYNII